MTSGSVLRNRPGLVGPALLGTALVLLGLQARGGPIFGVAVAIAGVAGGLALARRRFAFGPALPLVPAGAALAVLVAAVPDSLWADTLAGLAALGLLLVLIDGPGFADGWGTAPGELTIPVIAAAVAFLTRAASPLGTATVGEASLVIVLVILAAAYLYRRPGAVGAATS